MKWEELWPGTLVGRSFSAATLLNELNRHLPFFAPQFPAFKQDDWTRCSLRHLLVSLSMRCIHVIHSRLNIWNTCKAHWVLLFPESSLPTHPDVADG